ncbi:GAF domain-containing protein [Pseudanabaena sp. FACHB-1998]|uniref:GAF domain-containing protein n=1 Tax=Pseudanabaena sp. FACHB-1998 TaxID=2692858 RepID=UPI00168049B2|nr:GAF domain-containing protein [Pseudanabaena sp. FACHB-1998]MBD2177875.1 GAF domain-containing protein [Pseudanabaena sp. FACHB-1998]
MNEALPSVQHSAQPSNQSLVDLIAKAMLSSNSLEDVLKVFLSSLGEHLEANRVAIYHLTEPQQGEILVEAISANIQSIKNQQYPLAYFGIDQIHDFPSDRVTILTDLAQITERMVVHQAWQDTHTKSMMSAPIVLSTLTSRTKIWGLAFVQQCDRIRQWQPQEAKFLLEISQVLGQCLEIWDCRLRSSPDSPIDPYMPKQVVRKSEQEEFIAKRIDLSEQSPELSSDLCLEEISVSSEFTLSDDDENDLFSNLGDRHEEEAINLAINQAMQRLDQKFMNKADSYSLSFVPNDRYQDNDDVDVDSITLEDVLEDFNKEKVQFLQEKVNELIESLQYKYDEIALLQNQVQELIKSQQEFKKILLELQSEDLTQTIKDAFQKMHQFLYPN